MIAFLALALFVHAVSPAVAQILPLHTPKERVDLAVAPLQCQAG
jgi:hypothetical protein